MKIAIPTRNNAVDGHFGHCEYFTIFDIDTKSEISKTEIFEAPKACGCKSNLVDTFKEMGVDTMLAGNMGQGALNKLESAQIKVIRGCNGDVKEVVNAFLQGKIEDSKDLCDHHSHDHNCSH